MFSYDKLFQKMKDENMTSKELCQKTGININMPARIKSGASITTDVLDKLCTLFNCQISDLVEWYPDEKTMEKEKIQAQIEALKKQLENM